jgi:hypothetical protein
MQLCPQEPASRCVAHIGARNALAVSTASWCWKLCLPAGEPEVLSGRTCAPGCLRVRSAGHARPGSIIKFLSRKGLAWTCGMRWIVGKAQVGIRTSSSAESLRSVYVCAMPEPGVADEHGSSQHLGDSSCAYSLEGSRCACPDFHLGWHQPFVPVVPGGFPRVRCTQHCVLLVSLMHACVPAEKAMG